MGTLNRWIAVIAGIAIIVLLLSANTDDQNSVALHLGASIVIGGGFLIWILSQPSK